MTIVSTPKMQRAFERAIETGDASRDALEYAIAKGYSQETIDKIENGIKAKVKASRARLAIQGAPLLYREPEPLRNSNDPTQEWLTRAGKRIATETAGRGDVIGAKRFKVRYLFEQYRHELGEDRVRACEQCLYDAQYALKVKVANHQMKSGEKPAPGVGGVGVQPQRVRTSIARFEWVLKHLSWEAKLAIKCMITCEVLNNDGSIQTFEDFGRRMIPGVKLVGRLHGQGKGALWMVSSEIKHLYEICPISAHPRAEEQRWNDLGYVVETKPRHAAAFVMPQ
ncbi:hypothetical protein [Hyphomicrobium sp. DY-1]|uniref:hypothetical protein n=1 Tax=Hyphomicrobium sp. DY-1 TaxID=3075650 RepID=UPI0039C2E0D9